MKQQIVASANIEIDLAKLIAGCSYDKLFLLQDSNTEKLCLDKIISIPEINQSLKLTIPSGDENKNIETLGFVWQFLSDNGATRNSLLINLGGGMLTDLGGFAAATFKRGMRFINIPTTLLGAVDAAVGGKTGINFNGLKNEIGSFAPAMAVLIHANFFQTLSHKELLSGYAEMVKHALLNSKEELTKVLQFDLEHIDYETLNTLLFGSVLIKERIVEEDPTEKGIRKALNLGHTFGHAFESLAMDTGNPVPHGHAVAWGIVCELYLSFIQFGFDKNTLIRLASFVKEHYNKPDFDCKQYDALIELMKHDKKNDSSAINFTLLQSVGGIKINQTAGREEIEEALDFLRDY